MKTNDAYVRDVFIRDVFIRDVCIRHATEADTGVIEEIMLDVVTWMDTTGRHQWPAEESTWDYLKNRFKAEDFHTGFVEGEGACCCVIIDHDPNFWPDVPLGESLYLHKVAVKRKFAGEGYCDAMLDYAKDMARERGIKTLRLDAHQSRTKVRAIYERNGFKCVEEKTMFGYYHTAMYLCEL